nr:hypothetical protein [Tanacetum cinerariifolium]
MLKQGEYDMWRLRIEQYFQVQDYALWDVIENGNSFKLVGQTTTDDVGTSTTLIPGPITTEEKAQKKNDIKARSMLLMALPNEHLTTFNQYKDAKALFAAIQIRFGGNEATKKTQKTLLKQMYENFSTSSTDSFDSIFNRFKRFLPSKWNTHVIVWRNKLDLDTMSFDDLHNNFKINEQEVKRTTSSSSNSNSRNMAFVSSLCSANEANTAYGVSTTNSQANLASTQVNTASTPVSTANLSDVTVYAFLTSQLNGSQLVHEDVIQINEDDLEEMDLKWQLALLSMRTKSFFRKLVERSLSMGVTQLDMTNPSSRRTVNVEDTSSNAMVAIDEAGFDWSFMADDEVPTNMALMAFFDSEHAIPPPPTGLFSPPKLDLSNSGLEESQQPEFEGYGPKTSKNVSEDIPNKVKESLAAPLVKELAPGPVNTTRPRSVNTARPKPVNTAKPRPVNTARPNSAVVNVVRVNQVNVVKASACWVWRPTKPNGASITLKQLNYIDVRGRSKNLIEDMLPLGEEPKEEELLVNELFILTPFEMLHGKVPSYEQLRVMGCLCFATISKPHKDKFSLRSIKSVLIGYSPGQKGYKLYNLEAHEVVCSRDVIFHEIIFPFKQVIPNTPERDSGPSESNTSEHQSHIHVVPLPNQAPPTRRSSRSITNSKWVGDMNKELQALETNDTWTLTELPSSHKEIYSKWVYKVKFSPNGTVDNYKARLVIRGFSQKEDLDYKHTFSPVAKAATVRVLIVIATAKGWPLYQLDVNNAFLHSYVEEEIYMKPPEGYTKAAPGQSKHDYSLFVKSQGEKFTIALVKYILDLLQDAGLTAAKPALFPLLQNLKLALDKGNPIKDAESYRRLVGRLLYLFMTRPNISYVVQHISPFVSSPKEPHLQAAMHLLRYIKGSINKGLFYPVQSNLKVAGFSDADWASCIMIRKSLTDQHIQVQVPITLFCDNKAAQQIAANPCYHERTKHMDIDSNFTRDKVQEGFLQTAYIYTSLQLVDIMTKALGSSQHSFLSHKLRFQDLPT